MRKFFVFLIGLTTLLFASCRTQQVAQLPIAPQPDTTGIPTFPAELFYVLGARWEADTALQDHTIADYIEQELMRLYPEKAYAGYINRLCALTDRLLVPSQRKPILFNPHKQEVNFSSAASLRTDFAAALDSLSLAEEMEVLELTP